MTAAEIAQYAAAAGFSGADLVTAVAIALAESSGTPGAVNTADPGGSYGLWQINLAAHPEYAGAVQSGQIFDPAFNAAAAFAVYQAAGASFRPWSTYPPSSGYLAQAQQGVASLGGSAPAVVAAAPPAGSSDDVLTLALGVGVGALVLVVLM